MRLDSITDMRNACASAFTNIDQIRTTKIGKNLLLKLFYRQAYRVFSSLLTIGLYEKKKKKSFFKQASSIAQTHHRNNKNKSLQYVFMYLIAHASVRKNKRKTSATKVNIQSVMSSCTIVEESLVVTMTFTRLEYICID